MRQIKFRGKSLSTGEWLYGDLHHELEDMIAIRTLLEGVPQTIDENTVGQFTGLLDRNGKEIYEGDIITVNGRYPRAVLWDKVSWALMPCEHYHNERFWVMNLQHPDNDWWEEFADEMEVVGNIHEPSKSKNDDRDTTT